MNKKQQLLEIAVKAVIEAREADKALTDLLAETTKASDKAVSAVEVACTASYKASLAGVSGVEIAKLAGVSEMTVSRYIASGKVAHQTDNKVTATKVNSDLGNKYMTITEAKNVENPSQYAKLVKAGKQAKAGNTAKAESRSPLDVVAGHVEAIGKAIKSGKVTLEDVTELLADMVAGLESEESDIEEMQEI
jgi:predicted transcriptional regulator